MTDNVDALRIGELESRLNDISVAVSHGDFTRAITLAGQALAQGFEHPALYSLRALGHEQAGALEASLEDLHRAAELAPEDYTVFNSIGLCLMQMGRLTDAFLAFGEAVRVGPGFAPAWFNLGRALEQLGRLTEAEEACTQAVALHGAFVEPMAALSELAQRRGDLAEARRWIERAVAEQPDNPKIRLAQAGLALAEKEPMAAVLQVERILTEGRAEPLDQALAKGLLGDAFDALGRPADAFAAWHACNRRVESLFPRAPGESGLAEVVGWLGDYFKAAPAAAWTVRPQSASDQEAEVHAFLLGFPRSGTTLLEHALGSHPDVATLEERETLTEAARDFLTDAEDIEVLATLPDDRLSAYRRAYWRRVRALGFEPGKRVFLDKQPMNTISLPLIAKLFPTAKVIFAQRDPRDVVFSCFRHRFQVNAMSWETLDLERCARFYSAVMDLRELYRAKLGYDEHTVAYEALVQDFEAECAAVCRFLGVPWNEAMKDFASRAKQGRVATVSGAQIARGLFQGGAGQWRRYEDQLTPALRILKPWVERFGYEVD